MPGHTTEPLSNGEIERYSSSALHIYPRGQSFNEHEYKAEDVRLLFSNYRVVFIFPWQSAQKRQNFFAVFTSPEAAVDARQQHKVQLWSVEPVDKHKSAKLHDLLRRVEVPKSRPSRIPTGPALNRSPLSVTPQPSPSPSISNATTSRFYDNTPPGWASSSQMPLKRSAYDAFDSPSEFEYPSKRRSTVASSTEVPLAVSTAMRQAEPPGSCPSWALDEIHKLRTELAQLKDKHAAESVEPEMRTLAIVPDQERLGQESSNSSPVFGPIPPGPTPPNVSAVAKSVETRNAGISTDEESLQAESRAKLFDLERQLESERDICRSLESELQEAKKIAEMSSKIETELRRQLEGMARHIQQGDKIHKAQFEMLYVEREQLQAKVRTLEASNNAGGSGLPLHAKNRPIPVSEDLQTLRGALVAEATRRVNAERARDEALAAKKNLEARIPAVVQLYKELEGIAAKAGVKSRVLTA